MGFNFSGDPPIEDDSSADQDDVVPEETPKIDGNESADENELDDIQLGSEVPDECTEEEPNLDTFDVKNNDFSEMNDDNMSESAQQECAPNTNTSDPSKGPEMAENQVDHQENMDINDESANDNPDSVERATMDQDNKGMTKQKTHETKQDSSIKNDTSKKSARKSKADMKKTLDQEQKESAKVKTVDEIDNGDAEQNEKESNENDEFQHVQDVQDNDKSALSGATIEQSKQVCKNSIP